MRTLLLAELGHEYVKIAISKGEKPSNIGYGLIQNPETFEAPVLNGVILDENEVSRIFVEYIRRNNLAGCDAKIILNHPKAAMRFGTFPKMRKTQLNKVLKHRMSGMFPDTQIDFVYDYRTYTSGSITNVIVARIPLDASRGIADFFQSLDLRPVLLDSFVNAACVYLERNHKGNFAAIFENTKSIGIIRFIDGKPVSSREILFSDRTYAINETQKYLRTLTGLDEAYEIYMLTNLGIIGGLSNFRLITPSNKYAVLSTVL